MKTFSLLCRSFGLFLVGFSGASSPIFAQGTAITGSVGLLSVPAPSASDTIVSLPLHRPEVFRGVIESLDGAMVNLRQASFSTDAYSGGFYLLIESGPGEGRWFPITANSGGSVTVEHSADPDFASVVEPGAIVKIIPFWTLDTVFPNGKGVNASGNLLPVSRVLLPDTQGTGTRLAPSSSFFYFSGAAHGGEGWRKFGHAPTVKFDDHLLLPGSSMIVRHDSGPQTVFENLGAVQTSAFSVRLGTRAPGRDQDHSLGLGIPAPVTLAQSALYESGGFAGTATLEQPVDQLLVYNQSAAAKNRIPAFTYYYYTGSQGAGPGWRLLGQPGTLQNAAAVFEPARGFVIRKAGGPAPVSARWTVRPAYLNVP